MSIVNPFGSRDSGKSEPPVQPRPVTPGRRSASSLSKDRGAPKNQQAAPSMSASLEQSHNQPQKHSSSTTSTAPTTHESTAPTSVLQYSHGASDSSTTLSSHSKSVSDDVFNDLLTDDDETGILSEYTKARAADSSAFESALSEFEEERKRLRRLYPTSGIKQSRFLLVDTLLKAPKTFFDAYAKDVEEGVIFVRNRLTDTGQSDLVRDAQEHPTEEEFQEKAFDAVHSLASESLAHSRWRDTHRAIIISLICNEIIGFGILDPLWRDSKVTEIMCNGPFDVQVEIAGEVYKVPCLRFKNANHLSDLLERLYRSVGKVLSQTTPRVKGRLHDKSRMFAVHTSVAPDGPNFNIRRHPQGFWTPQSMIDKGASSQEMMTFIGNLLYKGASCFVVGSTSSGKSLTLDSKILLPDGSYTTMKDINPGDKVVDRFGNTVGVTHKFMQEPRPVYKITFDTGDHVFCDLEHNWLVSTTNSVRKNLNRLRSRRNGLLKDQQVFSDHVIDRLNKELETCSDTDTITSDEICEIIERSAIPRRLNDKFAEYHRKPKPKKEILSKLVEYGSNLIGSARGKVGPLYQVKTTQEIINLMDSGEKVHVPLPSAIEFSDSMDVDELPIHPYLFGLWLGDGFSSASRLAADPKDAHEYNKIFEDLGIGKDILSLCKTQDREIVWKINIPGFRRTLHNLGVLSEKGKKMPTKFIPEIYMRSSVAARRMLIAGLLDSDGWSNEKSWGFSNTNTKILDGMRKVLFSLGIKSTVNAKKQKKKNHRVCYDLHIASREKLGMLSRKNAKIQQPRQQQSESVRAKKIISIERTCRIEEMACISTDGPDSTYITGPYTVTHNTSLMNALTGFYPERARILTLEDNLEMKPNPKKFLAAAMECKEPSNSDGGATGTSMRDLVHAAMQMRPEKIVLGEVSDSAAYDLCQALNTGHSGMSTFHANSSQLSITRICSLVAQSGMTTIEGATDLVAAAFDFIINVRHFPMDGSRRIVSIDEVGMEPVEIGGRLTLPVRQLWRFVDDGLTPEGKVKGHWEQVSDISQARKDAKMLDMEKDLTWEQLRELSSLPEGELEV